jgi:transcriptional regulator GlxA family with amidase domain
MVGVLSFRRVVISWFYTCMADKAIHLLVFPGLTILDLVGPLTVLQSLPAPFRTLTVGERVEAMTTDSGMQVVPHVAFRDGGTPFAFIVPGGAGALAAMVSEPIQEYVRAHSATADIVSSVCTGSLVLAAAGILAGRRATTHWAYANELERLGAHYVRERWVEEGNIITAAGVSAGIDMALMLAARLTDRATAQRIQLSIEYDPQPPIGRIEWSCVGDAELARQRQGGTGRQLSTRAAEIFATRPDLLKKLRQ